MPEKEILKEEVIIRNYRTSDYHATLELLKELNKMVDIGFNEKQWREASGLRQFKPNLKRITLIAELKTNGEVVSMGMIEAVKNTLGRYIGYLNHWATKKEYIGKKIGKLIVEKAIQILQSWGCDSVRINLPYGTSEKLHEIFGRTGFHPIITVLEKRF